MTEAPDSVSICGSNQRPAVSAAPRRYQSPPQVGQSEGRPVVRSPEQLRLHPALEQIGWTGMMDEFNDVARLTKLPVIEPILITTTGTILAGFGRWRLALLQGRHEIHCIEYLISEAESLQFILTHHQTRCG